MADQFVTIKRTGWLGNIMNSFVGVLFGIILFLVAFPVLWFNEGRTNMATVAQASTLVDGSRVSTQTEGQQVAVAGTLSSDERLGDAPYLAAGTYIQLERKVEMFAWVEHKSTDTRKDTGGSSTTTTTYTYEKQWTSSPEDSQSFEHPQGHSNPPLPVQSTTLVVSSAHVGVYTINPADITLPNPRDINLNSEIVTTAGNRRLVGNYILLGRGSFDTPQLGDTRISYSGVAANTPAIAFGQQQGSALVPYVTRQNDRLYRVFVNTDRAGAIQEMNTEYTVMTWILRLVGFLMMWIGLGLCFGPITTFLDVLPFLGSAGRFVVGLVALPVALVLSIITIVISFLVHNVLALIVVLGLLIGGVMLWGKLQKQRAQPAAG
jgi:Transmembrane protein 43